MTQKELRKALRAGERVYGTLIVSDSPRWPGAIASVGLDFVFIDTEHVALDRQPLSWMCQTYGALGLPALVRIPSPDPYAACMALDAGAAGIIAPYVETVDQVKSLTGAVKLRPIKGARLESVLNGRARFEPGLAAYQKNNYEDNILIINVESLPALNNLDALLAVEGLDGTLIGPHDLSSSLGIPESYDGAEFRAAVQTILRKTRSRGLAAGIHSWMGIAAETEWGQIGANFIIHSADIIAMREKLTADIKELKAALGDLDRCAGRQAVNI